jgi:hypothetical protein
MPDQSPIEALIERAGRLTLSELAALAASWDAWAAVGDAAWGDSWAAVGDAAWASAWTAGDAAGDAAGAAAMAAGAATWSATMAARAAAFALALRDWLTQEHYRALTGPWARVVGRVHPDDPDRRGGT